MFFTYLSCSFICLSCWSAVKLSQLRVSICSISQSVMPNKAGPLLGTTKKLHQNMMSLFIIVTLHMLVSCICQLLYACNTPFYPWTYLGQPFCVQMSILNILMGTKLPSLPVSIIYLHVVVWLLFVPGFVIFTDLTLWKLKIFALMMSKSQVHATVSSVS